MTNTSRELGGVLGVAALGAVVTSVFRRTFTERLIASGMTSQQAGHIVAQVGAGAAAGGSRGAGPVVFEAIQRSFVDAIHTGMVVSIVAMVIAAGVSFVFVRSHVSSNEEGR